MKLLLQLALVLPLITETNVSTSQNTISDYPPGDIHNCQLSVNNGPDYFDSWDDYTDATSASINVDTDFLSGKFSAGYTSTKTHMYNRQSRATRAQMRYKLYTVKIQPEAPLDPTFKSAVLEIAANIQSKNTDNANYLAQLLVRDYGTHYVTSVDAGGIIYSED